MIKAVTLKPFGKAETIAERKARIEYDRLHPWEAASTAIMDGSVCELLFSDMVGSFTGGDLRFVLTTVPKYNWVRWLCINKKGWAPYDPSGFRKTGQILDIKEINRMRRMAR